MRRNLIGALTLIGTSLAAFAAPVWATNYYVDFKNGLDTNSRLSTSAALKVIPAALAKISAAGDHVYVNPGGGITRVKKTRLAPPAMTFARAQGQAKAVAPEVRP